ncbi:hypothetical protein CP532_2890 [Ophiocordyceps camponoti-leonardi (nom. inval.)]|nr:hypothetical protein CP532_2890 [Ophiocordyceps camponoti-leonardi (nom. inval.)]
MKLSNFSVMLFIGAASCMDGNPLTSGPRRLNIKQRYRSWRDSASLFMPLPPETVYTKRDTESHALQESFASAVMHRNATAVKHFLENTNVNPGLPNRWGETPLFRAVMNDDKTVAKLLLDTGRAAPNRLDGSGWTPLTYAAMMGENELAALLLATSGVEPDAKDGTGWTPLLHAAAGGYDSIVQLLLASAGDGDRGNSVEVDAQDGQKRTPLWWAVENRHVAVVKLLVGSHRVKSTAEDVYGLSPLEIAKRSGDKEMIGLLGG